MFKVFEMTDFCIRSSTLRAYYYYYYYYYYHHHHHFARSVFRLRQVTANFSDFYPAHKTSSG